MATAKYEWSAIVDSLQEHEKSPLSGERIDRDIPLLPNNRLKSIITELGLSKAPA